MHREGEAMARNKKTPSQDTVPHQLKYDHEVPYVSRTTALPLGAPTDIAPFPIMTPAPSRFFEFMNVSKTNGKKGE